MAVPWTALTLVNAPAEEPILIEAARLQCSLGESTDFDARLTPLIAAARSKVEDVTGRKLVSQTWDVFYDCLMNPIVLPFGKLSEVAQFAYSPSVGSPVSFTITDGDVISGSTTLAHVEADNEATYSTGRIILAYGQQWPTATLRTSRPIRIRIIVGWQVANIPPRLIQAVKLLVGHWFRNTEETSDSQTYPIPHGFESLVQDYIVLA